MTVAVVDADYIRYAVASAGEKRSIRATHRTTGRTKEFDTRTQLWGDWRKKEGGYLAEINANRDSPFTWDEFDIEDLQVAEPIENVLHSAKLMYEGAVKQIDATKHKGFMGKGDSFRKEVSTILEYKGNRVDLQKPILLQEVGEYLVKKFKMEVVETHEADDAVVIEAYKKKDHVVVGVDKDALGQPVLSYNPNKPDMGIVNGNQFGKLWLDNKGEVRGIGRLFLYFQTSYGDDVDNYKANCASDTKWGKKATYKALVDCKGDKEAIEAVCNVYKTLYPEPKIITGWRGDEFEIDWLYVSNENFRLARMLRTMDELYNPITFTSVLDKMGIEYD